MLALSKHGTFLITLEDFFKSFWKNQKNSKTMQCKPMKFKWRALPSFKRPMRYAKEKKKKKRITQHVTFFSSWWKYLTSCAYLSQEQSKSEAEKLIADMANLVSSHVRRQKELVCFVYISLSDLLISVSITYVQNYLRVELAGRCKACWSTRKCYSKQIIFGWTCFIHGGYYDRCETEMAGIFYTSWKWSQW